MTVRMNDIAREAAETARRMGRRAPWDGLESSAPPAWDVESAPVYALTSHGLTEAPGSVANVRSDTGATLGIVSPRYQALPNAAHVDIMGGLTSALSLPPESVSWTEADGGGSVSARLALPLTLSPTVGDPHSVSVLTRNAHTGRGTFSALLSILALRCTNGMTSALLRVSFSARHARDVEESVRRAAAAIARAADRLPEWERMARRLSETSLSREAAERIARAAVDTMLPVRDASRAGDRPAAASIRRSLAVSAAAESVGSVRSAVADALPVVSLDAIIAETALRTPGVRTGDEDNPDSLIARRRREALDAILSAAAGEDVRESGLIGSAWGLYHGATAWLDHGQSYRGDERSRAENRMDSTLWGRAAEARDSVLSLILEETGVPAARLN